MSKEARYQNAFLMLVSLVVAFVWWLHVQSQLNPPTTSRELQLKVKPINIDWSRFVTVKEPPLVTITMMGGEEIKGAAEDMATIDLTDARPGKNTCTVFVQPPPGIQRDQLRVTPKRVDIYLDYRVTVTKEVELKLSGLQPKDYIFNGVTKQASQVDLTGPKTMVDSVKHVQVIFDLSKARAEQALRVEALDKDEKIVPNVKCDPDTIRARASLSPAPTTKTLIVTPRWSGQFAFGYEPTQIEVQPNVVDVTGKSETLSRLVTIETEPISVEGLSEDKTVEVRMIVPKGVSINAPAIVRVHVKVEKSGSNSGPSRAPS